MIFMKKISYALLCLALTFGMMGCNTEKQNASTRLKSDYVLTGETKHCFTDRNLKPINLKKYALQFHEKFLKLLENN